MQKPQVIFLDAVGTLFGIRGSVGEIYGEIAANFGVNGSADRLNRAFIKSFQSAPPLAFPWVESDRIPELELQWWRSVTHSTYENAGYIAEFSDFEAFFRQLYQHFASTAPWFLYEDVLPSLNRWQAQGIELGIISNFDSRIYSVLKQLQIDRFFKTITISSLTGAAKPDSLIFQTALKKHDCPNDRAWHIGDSGTEDYEGAKAVGIRPFLLKRSNF